MICFDTAVLIWGVQGSALPTPAVTEYLQFFGATERERQLKVLERHFVIYAYDLPSAYLAADIAHNLNAPKASEGVARQAVKTDIQILATALVHGATRLITHDRHFEKLAAGRPIKISEVPAVEEQGLLFEP